MQINIKFLGLMIMQVITTYAVSSASYANYAFTIKGQENQTGIIELVATPAEIDQFQARKILVASFINEYQKPYLNISPSDIGEGLISWHGETKSVQKYYEDYFASEFSEFANNKIDYWIQAKINGELVGWATFQKENLEPNAIYMNLLVVSPQFQNQGIGKELVFAFKHLPAFSQIDTVHLLLRIKNQGGRTFYKKLGFFVDPKYQRPDNFVDMKLLEAWTWTKK